MNRPPLTKRDVLHFPDVRPWRGIPLNIPGMIMSPIERFTENSMPGCSNLAHSRHVIVATSRSMCDRVRAWPEEFDESC